MSKKPMTWLDLIKLKLVQIKEGKHPLYSQGKAQTFARKKKTGTEKTRKAKGSRSPSSSPSSSAELEQLLAELKMCGKCKKKVDKYMKKKVMKGGNTCSGPGPAPAPITGGGQAAGCSSCPM
jgi:hypothetical protein